MILVQTNETDGKEVNRLRSTDQAPILDINYAKCLRVELILYCNKYPVHVLFVCIFYNISINCVNNLNVRKSSLGK